MKNKIIVGLNIVILLVFVQSNWGGNAHAEESKNKNHCDDNYSAFHIRDARSLRFCIYVPFFK